MSILVLSFTLLLAEPEAQSLVTKTDIPGTRNLSIVHYDDRFLFLARNYGDLRDFHGSTEPAFFVHSRTHDRWLQILQVSTKNARFSKSHSDNPEENKRLTMSSVGWDFTDYTKQASIGLPLKTSGSIVFPDRIEFDEQQDSYKLSFFTNWKIASVVTVLYINRKDLVEQFDNARVSPARENKADRRLDD